MSSNVDLVDAMKDVLLGIHCVPGCSNCMFDVPRSAICKHTILLDMIAEIKLNNVTGVDIE